MDQPQELDVKRRIGIATTRAGQLRHIFNSKHDNMKVKMRLYRMRQPLYHSSLTGVRRGPYYLKRFVNWTALTVGFSHVSQANLFMRRRAIPVSS